jgi:hypothetical protein
MEQRIFTNQALHEEGSRHRAAATSKELKVRGTHLIA